MKDEWKKTANGDYSLDIRVDAPTADFFAEAAKAGFGKDAGDVASFAVRVWLFENWAKARSQKAQDASRLTRAAFAVEKAAKKPAKKWTAKKTAKKTVARRK